MAESPVPKRPYGLLRAVLSAWLLGWGITIVFFLVSQFGDQPLFGWKLASVWLGVSILGWWLVYRVLQRLRNLPPE